MVRRKAGRLTGRLVDRPVSSLGRRLPSTRVLRVNVRTRSRSGTGTALTRFNLSGGRAFFSSFCASRERRRVESLPPILGAIVFVLGPNFDQIAPQRISARLTRFQFTLSIRLVCTFENSCFYHQFQLRHNFVPHNRLSKLLTSFAPEIGSKIKWGFLPK